MGAFTIVSIVLASVQLLVAWRQHRHGQVIASLISDRDHKQACAAMAPAPDRLLHDLDADALVAGSLMGKMNDAMTSLADLAKRLDSLVANPRFAPGVAGSWSETSDGRKAWVPDCTGD